MTTEGKHTPGPWYADGHDIYDGSTVGERELIATAYGFEDAESGKIIYTAETYANAALIARAPDLLAENERLREALDGTLGLIRKAQERLCAHLHPDSHGDDAQCMNELLEMFDGPEQREIERKARAAMEKAPAALGDK